MRHTIRLTVGLFSLLALSCYSGDEGDGLPPSGDNPAQTNDDDSDNCTLTCEDGETLDSVACTCLPPNECGQPVDPALLVGKAWGFQFSQATINQYCESPPTKPLTCDLIENAFGPVPWLIIEADVMEDDQIGLQIRWEATGAGNTAGPQISLPPSGYAPNPCIENRQVDFVWGAPADGINIAELYIEGQFSGDLDSLLIHTFRLVIDLGPRWDIGLHPCQSLDICEPDYTLIIQLKDLEAPLVESPSP